MQRISALILVLGFLGGTAAAPGISRAQHHSPHNAGVDSFLTEARAATKKFKRLEAAIAAGYRKVGPDFPGMGEHWVHVGRVVADDLDPRRPAVLSYLRVNGEPLLTGAAYAIPLQRGESPPEFPFRGAWHAHDGTIADETLHLNPDHSHHADHNAPRLAMIHAWIWTENPAGIFTQDNWALPFARLNLPVPEKIPPQAGKALFLETGGVSYYARLIRRAGSPMSAEMTVVRRILKKYRSRVSSVASELRSNRLTANEAARKLESLWFDLWDDLRGQLPNNLWQQIENLSG